MAKNMIRLFLHKDQWLPRREYFCSLLMQGACKVWPDGTRYELRQAPPVCFGELYEVAVVSTPDMENGSLGWSHSGPPEWIAEGGYYLIDRCKVGREIIYETNV
jgi:hypothetical protein